MSCWMRGTGVAAGKHELYTLFYDIKQAYDSVQTSVLVRALHRLRMPAAFVAPDRGQPHWPLLLRAHCLRLHSRCSPCSAACARATHLLRCCSSSSWMRCMRGWSATRSLESGMDCGSSCVAATRLSISSLGYADDTTALTNSLPSCACRTTGCTTSCASITAPQPHQVRAGGAIRRSSCQPVTAADLAALQASTSRARH